MERFWISAHWTGGSLLSRTVACKLEEAKQEAREVYTFLHSRGHGIERIRIYDDNKREPLWEWKA